MRKPMRASSRGPTELPIFASTRARPRHGLLVAALVLLTLALALLRLV